MDGFRAFFDGFRMVCGRFSNGFEWLRAVLVAKDSEKKISELLTESIATLGENITISRYIRFAVGETPATSNGQQ